MTAPVIDANDGRLHFAGGVTLDASFNASAMRASSLSAHAQPLTANPPWHTLGFNADLADGIPVSVTLVFHDSRLCQAQLHFRYGADVDESLVHEQHEAWVTRVLGGGDHVYEWGTVTTDYDPRNDISSITITWRGASPLHDQAMPLP